MGRRLPELPTPCPHGLVAESDRLRAAGADAFAAADFFAAAFDPDPLLAESCADRRRHRFVAQLLDTPGYRELHAATRLDDTAAGIAAAHFAEQFARLGAEERDHPGGAAAGGGDVVADEMATLRAVAGVGGEVAELRDAAAALRMRPGSPGANDPRAVAELFKRVRGDPALRRVCELAGRFRRVAQSKQRMKVTHGLDDVVGVEPGGDVGRLLPVELGSLMVPELELDALRRIAERQALCREHRAVEPAGKGPVVVCVDESGSMAGEKAHAAKALALALAWVARHQRRWCALVAYSGDTGERLLALPPGRWDELKLADWLAAFLGGGSDLDIPVREMPRMWAALKAPPGVTDVVFVTDARCRLPANVKNRFWNGRRLRRPGSSPSSSTTRRATSPPSATRSTWSAPSPPTATPSAGCSRCSPGPLADGLVATRARGGSRSGRPELRASRSQTRRRFFRTATATIPFPVAAGTRLQGEVIAWTCSGVAVTHPALVAALRDAGLDESIARELAPATPSPGRASGCATGGSSAGWPRTRPP